jgi:hypothetical protein
MFFWNERKNKKIRKNTLEKYSKYYLLLEFWISCFFFELNYKHCTQKNVQLYNFINFDLKTYSSVILCENSESVYGIEISLFNKKLLRLECFWQNILWWSELSLRTNHFLSLLSIKIGSYMIVEAILMVRGEKYKFENSESFDRIRCHKNFCI